VPTLVKQSLGKGAPLAVITGKELQDAHREILEPIRNQIAELGLNVQPHQALIYANNGSVVYDMASDRIIKQRIFEYSVLEAITNLPGIINILELHEHIGGVGNQISDNLSGTHFRLEE